MNAVDQPVSVLVEELLRREFDGCTERTLNEKIQELLDREEIKELIARYAQRVAHRMSVVDLFTEDGAFILRVPGQAPIESRGREQLEKIYSVIWTSPTLSMPAIHNHVISISGDSAAAVCFVESHVRENGSRSFSGCGHYEDQLRRENGRWKFITRDVKGLVAAGSPLSGDRFDTGE